MLGVSIRKMKTLTLKIETVTLISKGTGNDILCITCTKIKVKYFFSADVLFCGGGIILHFDKYTYLCKHALFGGDCLR